MSYLEKIFHIWDILYDKNQDPKVAIEEFFHKDYNQTINGLSLNRAEYINHIIEQRKTIESMEFKLKNHMLQDDKLFIIYNARGKNIEGNDIEAEIIAYFEFKNEKLFKIHGQVHLIKGNSSDIDMSENNA